MTVLAKYAAYSSAGTRMGGGSMQMPEYLDWMPIEVKAEWFRFIGQGPDDTHYIVFVSQGQEILLDGVALAQIDHKTFLQKEASAEEHINRFIEEKGYSREPRNQ